MLTGTPASAGTTLGIAGAAVGGLVAAGGADGPEVTDKVDADPGVCVAAGVGTDNGLAGPGTIGAGATTTCGRLGGSGSGAGTGAAETGTCGVPIIASCGVAPARTTCSCNVVPAGSCWGNCAVMTRSPTLSAVMPSAVLPRTVASSACPGLNTGGSAAVRAAAFWASN